MPQSLARVWLHLVFSTKDRRAYLQRDDFREEMFQMLGHHVAHRTGGFELNHQVLQGLKPPGGSPDPHHIAQAGGIQVGA